MRKAFEDLIKQLIGGLVDIFLLVTFATCCISVLGLSLAVWAFEFSILALILVAMSIVATLILRKDLISKAWRTSVNRSRVAMTLDILIALQTGVGVIIWWEANLYSFCLLAVATFVATMYRNKSLPWGCR